MNVDLVEVQRALGFKGGLHRFIRMAWHVVEPERPFTDNWHIGAICEHLEALHRGQIRRLIINVPPGTGKSLACNVFFPAWCWIQDPGYKILLAAYDARLVGARDGGKTLDLVRSPWFKARWGNRVMVPTDCAVNDFSTSAKGFRYATSVRGPLTGQHGHGLMVDDPHKANDLSENALGGVEEWWRKTTTSRVLPGGWRALIMQRLHANDLAGVLLKEGGYEHLCLPMRFESAQACSTSIGFRDPRTEDGELLWPSYKNEEEVTQQEKDMGSQTAAAQLQQRPAPDAGLIFQRVWFKTYRVAPAKFDATCMSFDLTFKDTSKRAGGKIDYVAAGVYGRKGGEYYLLDLHLERLDFPATLELIRRKTRRFPKVLAKLVEDKANGPAVLSMLKKEISGLMPVTPEGGKDARANAVAPLYEAGNVFYPHADGAELDGHRVAITWDGKPGSIDQHIESMAAFPFAPNDDDVDAETQALLYLRTRASRLVAAMQAMKGRT